MPVELTIGLLVVVVVLLQLLIVFWQVIRMSENVRQEWAALAGLIMQRNELVPQLVDACKRHASIDKSAVGRIIAARSGSTSACGTSDVLALARSESLMSSGISSISTAVRLHPSLMSDHALGHILDRLANVEAAIAQARGAYNLSVKLMNSRLGSFPTMIWAALMGVHKDDTLEWKGAFNAQEVYLTSTVKPGAMAKAG